MGYEYITVVSISGHNNGGSSLPSIKKSISELPGSLGLLLSIEKPINLPSDITWMEIPKLNYLQYSIFVIHFLKSFVHTEYALIVQEDGWVLNGNNWDDDFLNYDYIGAPCHSAYVDGKLVNNFGWIGSPEPVIVQNGGLSLRSKKMLEKPGNYKLFYDFSKQSPECNEDVIITGLNRLFLQDQGIKFAPLSIAKKFSIEYFAPIVHDDIEIQEIFGIHGQLRRLKNLNTIQYGIPLSDINGSIYREDEIHKFFIENGYCVF